MGKELKKKININQKTTNAAHGSVFCSKRCFALVYYLLHKENLFEFKLFC